MLYTDGLPDAVNGYRTVLTGPARPYIVGGMPLDGPSAGFGHNENFAFQRCAFLDELSGNHALPRCAGFAEGLRKLVSLV